MKNPDTAVKIKPWIYTLLLGWLVLHFSLTAIYVSPSKYFPEFLNRIASGYISPIFHQAWHLFAPNPPVKHKELIYRVKLNNEWSEWYSPGDTLLLAHDRWRLGRNNIRYRMHQNAAYRLWAEYEVAFDTSAVRGARFDSGDYLMNARGVKTARHYILQQYRMGNNPTVPDSIEYSIILYTPPAFPDYQGDWKTDVLKFPPVGLYE